MFVQLARGQSEDLQLLYLCVCVCVCVCVCMHKRCHFSRVQLSSTLWTVVHQALLSMGFPRQEC